MMVLADWELLEQVRQLRPDHVERVKPPPQQVLMNHAKLLASFGLIGAILGLIVGAVYGRRRLRLPLRLASGSLGGTFGGALGSALGGLLDLVLSPGLGQVAPVVGAVVGAFVGAFTILRLAIGRFYRGTAPDSEKPQTPRRRAEERDETGEVPHAALQPQGGEPLEVSERDTIPSALASTSSRGKCRILISYRRADSADVTGRIYDRLVQHFDRESVFKDVDSIPLGIDFRQHLDTAVGQCNVLLAIIGRRWFGEEVGDEGARALNDPRDFVRIEVESALRRDIPVIPVLVQGATIPTEEDLPPSLRSLSYRNGIPIRPDPDFHRDMDRLIAGIEAHLEPA